MLQPRRILFAVDDSTNCRRAFKWFLQWMWRRGPSLESRSPKDEQLQQQQEDTITLVHVVAPPMHSHPLSAMDASLTAAQAEEGEETDEERDGVADGMEGAFAAGKAVCQSFLALAAEAGATKCDACVVLRRRSATGKAILRSAQSRCVDMIVIGSRGHGALHRASQLGSVGKYITKHSHIPVTLVPPDACPH